MDLRREPLVALGRWLKARAYRFTTVSPGTHARVNARPENAEARSVADVLGWSRPFRVGHRAELDGLAERLEQGGALERTGELFRSRLRVSSLGDGLYFHSAHPTLAADAVFFGPDTYRFAALLEQEVRKARRAVDVGCGSGAGGLCLGSRVDARVLADVNPRALVLAEVNAELAGLDAEIVSSDVLAGVRGSIDLVISNPPYLVDPAGRAYRDGGGQQGTALSVRIARESLERLSPGGRLVLYTATPILDAGDPLRAELVPLLDRAHARWTYRELDVDVWGEELDGDAYRHADRIAVVGLVAEVP